MVYNVEMIKDLLGDFLDTLHFDEAWLPHASFHDFYKDMHAIGKERPRAKESLIFSTQSTHKLLAGLSQASQILVQESETVQLDRDSFNEAYLMHISTSPQYAIIASCDIAAAMMEPPGGTALVEESILEALDFRRAMKKVDQEWGQDWWFQVWGPEEFAEEGIGSPDDWIINGKDNSAQFDGAYAVFGKVLTGCTGCEKLVDRIVATPIKPIKVEKFGEAPFTAKNVPATPIRILSATVLQE